MRFVKITLQLLILSSLLLGCRKDIPKPETNISILPIDYVDAAANTPVSVLEDERDRTFLSGIMLEMGISILNV